MKKIFLPLLLLSSLASAQLRDLRGVVTFVAGPTAYSDLARNDHLPDSATGWVISAKDTVAVLRLIAVSSRSSSWSILRSSRDLRIKDTITTVTKDIPEASGALPDTVRSVLDVPAGYSRRLAQRYTQNSLLTLHGRIGLQYYGARFETPSQSLAQPALALSVNAALRGLPMRFSIYGVHRQQVRGSLSPFDRRSEPQTRLYRASIEFDDGVTLASAGRIYPLNSLPMSVVDGASIARRFGNMVVGFAGGAEPTLTFNIRQKRVWKGMAYVGFQTSTPFYWGGGLVYSRSYIRSALVRETASFSMNVSTPSGISFTGYGDIDLRRPLSKSFAGDPTVTSMMFLGTVRILPSLSVFAGVDGARPVPAPTDYGVIPDTLFNRTMRSGLTAGTNVSLQSWLWTISYSPRLGPGPFGGEYTASTSIGSFNFLASGFEVRSTGNVSSNSFTTYASAGLQTRRNFLGIDLRIRFQHYGSTIRQTKATREGNVIGFDLVALLSQEVSAMLTYDSWRGATYMNVLFAELSWRF